MSCYNLYFKISFLYFQPLTSLIKMLFHLNYNYGRIILFYCYIISCNRYHVENGHLFTCLGRKWGLSKKDQILLISLKSYTGWNFMYCRIICIFEITLTQKIISGGKGRNFLLWNLLRDSHLCFCLTFCDEILCIYNI